MMKFLDIFELSLLSILILLVLVTFLLLKRQLNIMHVLFSDFFRFYIHISK
jgi:hypothetical protein